MAAEWLESLEDTVEKAVAEIERLRAENERLRGQIEARAAAGDDGGADPQAAEWRAERAEVRERVERLVDTLAGLID